MDNRQYLWVCCAKLCAPFIIHISDRYTHFVSVRFWPFATFIFTISFAFQCATIPLLLGVLWSDKWATVCGCATYATTYSTGYYWYPVTGDSQLRVDSQWARVAPNNDWTWSRIVYTSFFFYFLNLANQSIHKFGWHWKWEHSLSHVPDVF